MNKLRAILFVLTAVAALSFAHPAKANTITTFNVSGTCIPIGGFTGTTFGGTITIDVTAGTVTALNIIFQGLSAYNMINLSTPYLTDQWHLSAGNGGPFELSLFFTTGHTPPSLVGFTGGTIPLAGGDIHDNGFNFAYLINGGSITAPGGVPDGGSTVSLLGCALLGVAALRRKLNR